MAIISSMLPNRLSFLARSLPVPFFFPVAVMATGEPANRSILDLRHRTARILHQFEAAFAAQSKTFVPRKLQREAEFIRQQRRSLRSAAVNARSSLEGPQRKLSLNGLSAPFRGRSVGSR